MSDLIDRQAAIDAVKNYWKAEVDTIPKDADFSTVTGTCDVIMKHSAGICRVLDHLPSAQPDFDTVTKIDKAHDDGYKQGYLQGKADYESKTGKWIEVHGFCTPGGDPVWACSECGKGIHVYGIEHGTYGADVSDGQWKACPNCGARMMKEGE